MSATCRMSTCHIMSLQMTTLLRTGQSELWSSTGVPYTAHYHENGIIVQPDNAYLPWKRYGTGTPCPMPHNSATMQLLRGNGGAPGNAGGRPSVCMPKIAAPHPTTRMQARVPGVRP
jgi:hypothetical protein